MFVYIYIYIYIYISMYATLRELVFISSSALIFILFQLVFYLVFISRAGKIDNVQELKMKLYE